MRQWYRGTQKWGEREYCFVFQYISLLRERPGNVLVGKSMGARTCALTADLGVGLACGSIIGMAGITERVLTIEVDHRFQDSKSKRDACTMPQRGKNKRLARNRWSRSPAVPLRRRSRANPVGIYMCACSGIDSVLDSILNGAGSVENQSFPSVRSKRMPRLCLL